MKSYDNTIKYYELLMYFMISMIHSFELEHKR